MKLKKKTNNSKINAAKSCFLEKVNKIYKSLEKVVKEEKHLACFMKWDNLIQKPDKDLSRKGTYNGPHENKFEDLQKILVSQVQDLGIFIFIMWITNILCFHFIV